MTNTGLVVAVLALACVATGVVAQHFRHCESPLEFEAHVVQEDRSAKFFRRGHFAYDARAERTALIEEIRNGTDKEFFHAIHLFREKRSYYINLHTQVCEIAE